MIRAIIYLLIMVAAGAGFAWLASFEGEIVTIIAGQRIVMSIFHAACALIAGLAILLFMLWLLKSIITAPFTFKRHLNNRKRDRGYQALSQGLIAVMAGDITNARKMLKQGNRLIDENKEPLILLLDAQTKQLEGNSQAAIEVFAKMRQNPNMRLLGLRGLYSEALKSKAFDSAHQYAAEAAKLNASLQWANRATVEQLSLEGDWKEALSLFNAYEKIAKKNKTANNDQDLAHMRVVMLAGQAQDGFVSYPDEAKRNALKAAKLEPDFVPAINIAANILFKLNEVRKGSKMIEKLWSSSPHPDLALTYVNATEGASALERFKRAQTLASINPKSHQSRMIVARTALEAGEYDIARENALIIAEEAPTESVYLLLADIEAAQNGNEGKMREWLQMAVHAEPDPAWIADGLVVPHWVAISPISGQIGKCTWAQPAKNTHNHALDLAVEPEVTVLHLEAINQPVEAKDIEEETKDIKDETDVVVVEEKPTEPEKPAEPEKKAEPAEPEKPAIIEKPKDRKHSATNATKKNQVITPTIRILDAEAFDDNFDDRPKAPINRINVDDPGVDPEQK